MMNIIYFIVMFYLLVKLAESFAEMVDNYNKNYRNKKKKE